LQPLVPGFIGSDSPSSEWVTAKPKIWKCEEQPGILRFLVKGGKKGLQMCFFDFVSAWDCTLIHISGEFLVVVKSYQITIHHERSCRLEARQ
jgi:hypothetical protein